MSYWQGISQLTNKLVANKKVSEYFYKGSFMGVKPTVAKGVLPMEESFVSLFGDSVKSFQDEIQFATHAYTKNSGKLKYYVDKAFEGVSKEDELKLLQSLDGQQVSLSDNLIEREATLRAVLDKVWENVDASGIPAEKGVAYRQNYLPHLYDYDTLKKYHVPGNNRDVVLQNMMDSYSFTRNEAEVLLNKVIGKNARVKAFGPVDFHRVVDLPEYKMDKSIFDVYLNRSLKRTEFAKRFGVNHEKINQLALGLPEEQRPVFIELANAVLGPKVRGMTLEEDSAPLFKFLRNRIVKAYMGYSSLNNMYQGPYGAVVKTNTLSTMKAMRDLVMHNDDEFIKKIGAINSNMSSAFQEFADNTEFFNKTLFQDTEYYSRAVAGLAGKHYTKELYEGLLKGSLASREELTRLGLNPATILKRGLTEDDLLLVANTVIHETQFRFDSSRLPIFAQSPLGKFLYTLNSFNINWLNFVLKQGRDPVRLMKILGMGYVIGGMNNVTWSTILGKKMETKDLINPLTNLGYGSAFGLLSDMMENSPTGKALNIPVVSILNDAAQSGYKAIHGDFNPAIRFGARRVVLPELMQALPKPVALPIGLYARWKVESLTRAKKNKKKSK